MVWFHSIVPTSIAVLLPAFFPTSLSFLGVLLIRKNGIYERMPLLESRESVCFLAVQSRVA